MENPGRMSEPRTTSPARRFRNRKRLVRGLSVALCFCALSLGVSAGSIRLQTLEQRSDTAGAICIGRVIRQEAFLHPASLRIHTRSWIQVTEALKGRFPDSIQVVHPGGILDGVGQTDSSAPGLQVNQERLFFLRLRNDGTLFVPGGDSGAPVLENPTATQRKIGLRGAEPQSLPDRVRSLFPFPESAGLDLTPMFDPPGPRVQSTRGIATSASGASRRFTTADRGEAIEYIVDADALPESITLAQALNSLRRAFDLWSSVTSLKFSFGGVTSFGQAAVSAGLRDGRIWVQLHDLYGVIQDPAQLGVGGNDFLISSIFPNGGMGGNVAGVEFLPVTQGYVTIKHSNPAMRNLQTFEEVLGHEVGHVLSLLHSSDDPSESNPVLRDALMYRTAHEDGRGARLGAYDPPVVQKIYPRGNTPPFAYDRIFTGVTTPGPVPTLPGINQIEFRAYDLQGDALTLSVVDQRDSGAGKLVLEGNVVRFLPTGFFSGPRLDPANSFYSLVFLRASDGINGSPFRFVKVIAMQGDQHPRNAPDGLPDDWVAEYFGSAAAAVAPDADADGDGVSNLNEFLTGTNPRSANDPLRIRTIGRTRVEWDAMPYDLFEVHGTRDFQNWFRIGNPVSTAGSTAGLSLTGLEAQVPVLLRIFRVP
jgi:hypothetical protein